MADTRMPMIFIFRVCTPAVEAQQHIFIGRTSAFPRLYLVQVFNGFSFYLPVVVAETQQDLSQRGLGRVF
jgi:hypothetical protein